MNAVQHRRQLIAVTILAVLTTGLAACSGVWGTGQIADKVELPATWIFNDPDVGEGAEPDDSTPSMQLNADGSATVTNLPSGDIVDQDDYVCFEPSGDTYSGTATWAAQDGGLLKLEHGDTTLFWAGPGYMGSLDWFQLTLADCDESGRASFITSTLRPTVQ
jgi:hypothetical protein